MNLNGILMKVSSTSGEGVVSSETYLRFTQKGPRVSARYKGGSISRGYPVGAFLDDSRLVFRYTQVEASGAIHGGSSACDVSKGPDGRIRMLEHFTWRTRGGSGTNVFDETDAAPEG